MIAVLFEAEPHPGRNDAYLEAAERLRPLLARIDGFISIERFESLARPGKTERGARFDLRRLSVASRRSDSRLRDE
jgi:heme-degrading monooxygenase HmoA